MPATPLVFGIGRYTAVYRPERPLLNTDDYMHGLTDVRIADHHDHGGTVRSWLRDQQVHTAARYVVQRVQSRSFDSHGLVHPGLLDACSQLLGIVKFLRP